MNTQVQYLKKQCERRDAQVRVLMDAASMAAFEADLVGSIACAFAWDLAARAKELNQDWSNILLKDAIRMASEAEKAALG